MDLGVDGGPHRGRLEDGTEVPFSLVTVSAAGAGLVTVPMHSRLAQSG